MSGELVNLVGTDVTLEASGASVSDGAVGAADDDDLLSTDDPDYPFVKFLFTGGNASSAPDAGGLVYLYERRLNINGGGSNDEPTPTTTYPFRVVGAFALAAVTGAQAVELDNLWERPKDGDAEYYIGNECGQSIDSGWTLTATPYTGAPAA